MVAAVTTIVFVLALGYAALRDLMSYEIPNWIPLVIVVDYAALALLGDASLATIGQHVAVGLVVLAIGAALFFAHVLGGGDAKLLAASALWFGWPQFISFAYMVALFGGGLALVILALRRFPTPAAWNGIPWFRRLSSPDQGLPYGIAIAIAGMIAVREMAPASGWM